MDDVGRILEETAYDSTLADAKEFAGGLKREHGRSHIRSITDVRILCEECAGSKPPANHTCTRSATVRTLRTGASNRVHVLQPSLWVWQPWQTRLPRVLLSACPINGSGTVWQDNCAGSSGRQEPPMYGRTAHMCTVSRV